MGWMWNALWAHIGWAIGEMVIGLFLLVIIGLISLLIMTPRLIRQARCKHLHYHETGSCDAICTDCGKNLGFIGSWRDKLRAATPQ